MSWSRVSTRPRGRPIDPGVRDAEASELLELAAELSASDLVALIAIVRRAAEISECEGEEAAVAALSEVRTILAERKLDA